MSKEQCYILEIENLRYCILAIYGSREDELRSMFESAHNEAWKNYKEEK